MMTDKEFAISIFLIFISLIYLEEENICILKSSSNFYTSVA